MILWFVLRFGIYFLRAGNVSDGQIANWRASCVNLRILVCPVAVKTQKLTKIQASVERKLHDSLVRFTTKKPSVPGKHPTGKSSRIVRNVVFYEPEMSVTDLFPVTGTW